MVVPHRCATEVACRGESGTSRVQDDRAVNRAETPVPRLGRASPDGIEPTVRPSARSPPWRRWTRCVTSSARSSPLLGCRRRSGRTASRPGWRRRAEHSPTSPDRPTWPDNGRCVGASCGVGAGLAPVRGRSGSGGRRPSGERRSGLRRYSRSKSRRRTNTAVGRAAVGCVVGTRGARTGLGVGAADEGWRCMGAPPGGPPVFGSGAGRAV